MGEELAECCALTYTRKGRVGVNANGRKSASRGRSCSRNPGENGREKTQSRLNRGAFQSSRIAHGSLLKRRASVYSWTRKRLTSELLPSVFTLRRVDAHIEPAAGRSSRTHPRTGCAKGGLLSFHTKQRSQRSDGADRKEPLPVDERLTFRVL